MWPKNLGLFSWRVCWSGKLGLAPIFTQMSRWRPLLLPIINRRKSQKIATSQQQVMAHCKITNATSSTSYPCWDMNWMIVVCHGLQKLFSVHSASILLRLFCIDQTWTLFTWMSVPPHVDQLPRLSSLCQSFWQLEDWLIDWLIDWFTEQWVRSIHYTLLNVLTTKASEYPMDCSNSGSLLSSILTVFTGTRESG